VPDHEFISIIDCELCRVIPPSDTFREFRAPSERVAPPLPSSWASLSTVAVLALGFGSTWGDRDELRMCPSCGTYYEYRQSYNSGDVLEAETTDWYLGRLTPHGAAALLDRAQPPHTGSERGNVERRYPHIIQTLRCDLGRIQNEATFVVKRYVSEALTEHYLLASDWDTLKATLLDHPDPAVRVGTAMKLLWPVLSALERGHKYRGGDVGTAANRLITDKRKRALTITDKRKRTLIAVLAEGLSHDDEIASGAGDEPARTDLTALSTLKSCAWHLSLAVAIPSLAAWLAGDIAWRRERVRDILVKYVDGKAPGTAQLRASEVLSGVSAIDTEEARAVARHCRTVPLPVDSAS